MLRSNRVDALHGGNDAELLTIVAHFEQCLFHAFIHLQHEASNLEVRETSSLHLADEFGGNVFEFVVSFEFVLEVNDILKAVEEPLVNLCEFFDAFNGVTFFQRLSDSKYAEVSGVSEFFVEVVE